MSAALTVAAALILGHPQGYHQRVALSVSERAVDGLLVMDVDAGEKSQAIRAGADLDRDGVLSPKERAALKDRLAAAALGTLKLGLSSHRLELRAIDVKMSLRDSSAVGDGGVSMAVLFQGTVPSAISEGMKLEVEATSLDASHVLVEVSAVTRADGGVDALDRRELAPGEKWALRLGRLATVGRAAPARQ